MVDMAGTREGAQEILQMWSTKARGPVAMPQLPHRLIRHCSPRQTMSAIPESYIRSSCAHDSGLDRRLAVQSAGERRRCRHRRATIVRRLVGRRDYFFTRRSTSRIIKH